MFLYQVIEFAMQTLLFQFLKMSVNRRLKCYMIKKKYFILH